MLVLSYPWDILANGYDYKGEKSLVLRTQIMELNFQGLSPGLTTIY